ncbi:MAG: ATP-binding cassette domain-containing protein, partial [Armatimonadetes bacterium]|nr:ATP-binding cassette domain-containing protein [Armatimonadota bacterium]
MACRAGIVNPLSSNGAANVLEARGVYRVFVVRRRAAYEGLLALRDVNLAVRRGEFLTLIGPSGCGKSTVLNMFAGLVAPTEGEVQHDGRSVAGVNTNV